MSKPKILIVDDEPFNVDYLEQELEDLNYETVTAVNGLDALDKVQSQTPDLVLLDIMMPVMDGFEVLERLKADADRRDIPVIIISAQSDLRSVVKGIELGAEDYLPKPFEPVLLQARISSCLEKKRLRDLQQLYLKSLERELEIGREIQRGFLPAELPRVDGWEIAASFHAAYEVAGDFYDAFLLPDGHLACVIGDVCGKGVGAALFMTLFRSLIRATATTDILGGGEQPFSLTPARRLNHVISFTNKYITETHGASSMFATVFIGIIDLSDGKLTYLNCGHDPALILRKGSVIAALKPTGPLVGIIPEAVYTPQEILLENSDLLFMYTDGATDSQNPQDDFFGKERLLSAVEKYDQSPSVLLDAVNTQLLQFISTADQFDDITMLAVKRS
jgi:serine phosphatase RsbU (regulator of sigma subunit)